MPRGIIYDLERAANHVDSLTDLEVAQLLDRACFWIRERLRSSIHAQDPMFDLILSIEAASKKVLSEEEKIDALLDAADTIRLLLTR